MTDAQFRALDVLVPKLNRLNEAIRKTIASGVPVKVWLSQDSDGPHIDLSIISDEEMIALP